MPLATSPALYPPMPSASTNSPISGRDSIQSSLWSRTRPGSVRLADWSDCERFMGVSCPSCALDVIPVSGFLSTRSLEPQKLGFIVT